MAGSAAAGEKVAQNLTQQQRLAIETRDVSVALSAGAGCGKTFVLTRRFLSHLEPGAEPVDLSSLVAITFTERAAREMRERIRSECARRLRECPSEEADHWMRLVRQLDAARVDTIHAFCSKVLRSNAVEARLDPGFKTLEEMSTATILSHSVEATLRRLLSAENPDAIELVYEFGLDLTQERISSLVRQRFRIEFDAWSDTQPQDLMVLWKEHWQGEAIPRLLKRLGEGEAAARVLDFFDRIPVTDPKMAERVATLREQIPRLKAGDQNMVPLLSELRNAAMIKSISKKAWRTEDEKEEIKGLLDEFREEIGGCQRDTGFNESHALRSAEMGLALLRVTRQAVQDYDAAKAAEGGLDFDDLLIRARNLLRDSETVRRRMASGIKLLMVDEFQDTDPVQTNIVRNLCGDDLLRGKLFFVGDHKQSIYRFRRAEPRVFHELRGELPPDGRLPLSENFRSQPAILHFVNSLFDDVLTPEYEPLRPHLQQISPQPLIEFLFSTEEAETPAEEGDDADGGNGQSNGNGNGDHEETAPHRRQIEAEWVASRLQQLLNDGEPRIRTRDKITGQESLRVVERRDIVLLFRAMSDVRYYEEALRKQQLDYYVVGGHAFYAQQEVYDVVNLCRALQDPDDQISLLGVLRSPFFGLSDDALFALWSEYRDFNVALNQGLPDTVPESQRDRVLQAGLILRELRSKKDRVSSHALLQEAIARTGYDASLLAEFLGPRKLANLRKLLDMARTFDRAGVFTLADLVEQLQTSVTEEPKEALAATHPETSNVIRLMTIHQSKGLEFPVVVLVDMDRRPNDVPPPVVFDPQLGPLVRLPPKFEEQRPNPGLKLWGLREGDENLAETQRLLYVATTRAADLLILSARMAREGRFESPWMKLLNRKYDLRTGQPRMEVLARHSRELPEIRVHHNCPMPIPVPAAERHRRLGLAELRKAIEQTPVDPQAWPDLAKPLTVEPRFVKRFSVSLLETIDKELELRPVAVSSGRLFEVYESPARKPKLTFHGTREGIVKLRGREPERLGTIVHAVLERIQFGQPARVPNLVQAVIASGGFDVSEEVRAAAIKSVEGILASPLAKDLAEARHCHRELEFLLDWPDNGTSRLVAGTIDCLFESAKGEWVVFDYKTRVLMVEKEAQAILSEYELQLGTYCLAAKQLTGRLPHRVELVLVRDGVQRVSFVPNQAFADNVRQRIQAAMNARA